MEKRRKATVKIVFAVLGIISGVSIFFTFIAVKNVHAAIWGLLSGVFAVLVLQLHVAYRKNQLHLRFSETHLQGLQYLGGLASIGTILAAIIYFTLTAVLKQGYKMEGNGYMPAGIFSLMTLKWTVALFIFGKSYRKIFREDKEQTPFANGSTNLTM